MTAMLFRLAGGLGLFLLGMTLLTDGLKAYAGDALRRVLIRFTGTTRRAFLSGVLTTAVVQSSSATTVTVIGFVSAGLLTFPQAVGVVIGASLGTTATGWIVSVLGLKISMGFYALPLVAAGAFLRLLAQGRARSLGFALAGFGLIFIGIETLQTGMQSLGGLFRLADLPSSGLSGHLLVMAIGIALTLIMQSSSAAVATTLTALHAGAVSFEQAASLTIGAAIGTTVTGALAAIGGNVPARRTALAHVLFNLATGLIAVAILPILLSVIGWAQGHAGLAPGAVSLAAFHTTFLAIGVALFLPFVDRFARAIERLLPDRGPPLTRHLDPTLLHAPAVALEATRRALCETACALLDAATRALRAPADAAQTAGPVEARDALERIERFLAGIPAVSDSGPISVLRVAQIHAMDHLFRLQARLDVPYGIRTALAHESLLPAARECRTALTLAAEGLCGTASDGWRAELARRARDLGERYRVERPAMLRKTAEGEWEPARALESLDALRWLERMAYHAWRVAEYLGDKDTAAPPAPAAPAVATDAARPEVRPPAPAAADGAVNPAIRGQAGFRSG